MTSTRARSPGSAGREPPGRRPLTPALLGPVVISHLTMLVVIWAGALPYVVAQLLLAAELLLINLATVPLYWSRGLIRHIRDTLKFSALLLFLLFFVAVTYGSVSGFHGSEGLEAARLALAGVESSTLVWCAIYLLANLLILGFQSFSSAKPRLTWTRGALLESGTNLVTLFLSIFVVLFVGMPLIEGLRRVVDPVSIDGVLGTLVVVARFSVAVFILRTFTERDLDEISANPYAE